MKKTIRRSVGLALLAAGAFLASPLPATIGQTAGMLPGDSDLVIAINLKAMENNESLMSSLTRAELEAAAKTELDKEGLNQPYENPAEAAMRVALTSGATATRTDYIAIGMYNNETGEPDLRAVIMGDYTADPAAAVSSLGGTKTDTGAISFASTTEGKVVSAASPKQDVMVFSNDATWSSGVMDTVTNKTNLSADGSEFNALAATLSGRTPDVVVFIPGSLIQETVGTDPQAQAMAAPMLKAKGLLLTMLPGAEPSIEITGSFPTPADATLAKQWADSMIQLVKMQAASALPQITDPVQKAELEKQVEMINSIAITATDANMTLKAPLKGLPPKEEIKQQILNAMKSSLDSGMPSAPVPGM